MIQIDHMVNLAEGLHAKPAVELLDIISGLNIQMFISNGNKIANIENVTEVVGLCIKYGQKIIIIIQGKDEQTAENLVKQYILENL